MSKEELKEIVKQLKLEGGLESFLLELIDKTKEANAALLNGIADILDLQADFYEKVADMLEEEARTYDSLNLEFNRIDEELQSRRTEEIEILQQQLAEDIASKMQDIKMVESSPEESPTSAPSTAESTASINTP